MSGTRTSGPDFVVPGGVMPACAGMDPVIFFPTPTTPADQIEEARAACRRCDLADRCRALALTQHADHLFGVWGGTTQAERQEYRRLRGGQK